MLWSRLWLYFKIPCSLSACAFAAQRQDAEDTMQEVLIRSVPYLPDSIVRKALVV